MCVFVYKGVAEMNRDRDPRSHRREGAKAIAIVGGFATVDAGADRSAAVRCLVVLPSDVDLL